MQGQWTELRGGALPGVGGGDTTRRDYPRSLACCIALTAGRRVERRSLRAGGAARAGPRAGPRASSTTRLYPFVRPTRSRTGANCHANRCRTAAPSHREAAQAPGHRGAKPRRCPERTARLHKLPLRRAARRSSVAMADATYGASTPTETEDERTTLIQKRRPRRLRRSVVAASVLVLCGTAVKVRPRVQEYRLGSDVGELGEYPTATWEAINNDSVDKVYDLEEHILVTTEVNDAYVFYKELLFGRLGRATGTLDPSRGIRVKSHAYATSAWNTFQSNLDDKLVKANSLVWVSVVNTMDTLVAGGMQKELNAMGVADEVIYWGCNSGDVCDGSDGELLVGNVCIRMGMIYCCTTRC